MSSATRSSASDSYVSARASSSSSSDSTTSGPGTRTLSSSSSDHRINELGTSEPETCTLRELLHQEYIRPSNRPREDDLLGYWKSVWSEEAPDVRIKEARDRVQGYPARIKADGAFKSPGHVASLLARLFEDSDGIFSVVDVTVDSAGNCREYCSTDPEKLINVLERLVLAVTGPHSPPEDLEWKYFIVEDLTPEVVALLGGFLDLPPKFFLTHVEGGGLEEQERPQELHVSGRRLSRAARTARAAQYGLPHGNEDDWDTEGDAEWNRHTWQRTMNNLDETLEHFASEPRAGQFRHQPTRKERQPGQPRSFIIPEHLQNKHKYRRAGFFSSAFSAAARGASPRGITSISGRRDLDYRRQISSRIFRPVFEVGLRASVGSFQERITTLWTASPMKVGVILLDKYEMKKRRNYRYPDKLEEADSWPTGEDSTRNHVTFTLIKAAKKVHQLRGASRNPSSVLKYMEVALLKDIARFWRTGLQVLSKSLDDLDLTIGSNQRPGLSDVANWQWLLAIWRSRIPQMIQELEGTKIRTDELKNALDSQSLPYDRTLTSTYPQLITRCTVLQDRTERTSQSLMSNLSVRESQNAIQQGHELQKLTELAFVFIPISFAASYFGMEVQDWDGDQKPRLYSFWATAGGLVLALYIMRLVLYSTFYKHIRDVIRTDFAETKLEKRSPTGVTDIFMYLIWRGDLPRVVFLVLLLYGPLVPLWVFRPPSWPRYIPLLGTLFWFCCGYVPRSLVRSSRFFSRDQSGLLFYGTRPVIVLFMFSFPALLINIGDLPGTDKWSKVLRIVPVAVVSAVALVVFGSYMWLKGRRKSEPMIESEFRR